MNATAFDRLAKALTGTSTRRGAIGRLVTAPLAKAMLLAPGNAVAGKRHRRRVRHRRDHDNRKGKRTGGKPRPRRDDPPLADCTKPGTWGQPCARTEFNQILRCCDGACAAAPTCVPVGRYTDVACSSSADCGPAAAQCCTRASVCDRLEGYCDCAHGEPGDTCGFDADCLDVGGVGCVCGRCR